MSRFDPVVSILLEHFNKVEVAWRLQGENIDSQLSNFCFRFS